MTAGIKGVLFDSASTLVGPIGGSWFPGRRWDEIIAAHHSGEDLSQLKWHKLDGALDQAFQYLLDNHYPRTIDEEREQFQVYYGRLLDAVGIDPSPNLTLALAGAMVDENNILPFPETVGVVERLHARGVLTGVLSNAWPSLDLKYKAVGLRRYFDPFVISSVHGTLKPAEEIYALALDAIRLSPAETLFVDDAPENVEAARRLGLHSLLIARDGPPASDLPWISDFRQVEGMVG